MGVSLVPAVAGQVPAAADPSPTPRPEAAPAAAVAVDDDHVVVDDRTWAGEALARHAYDRSGRALSASALAALPPLRDPLSGDPAPPGAEELDVALGRGSGGSPSSTGCRTVTVRNEKETSIFGATAYWFNTWTRWCWKDGSNEVYDVSTGWYLDDVDTQFYWEGLIVDSGRFYQHAPGYKNSGYWHEKQGRFDNCILKFGCISTTYPRNILRSHDDGTWSWETHD